MKGNEEKYNGWKVHKPEWENYPKWICTKEHYWTGLFGSAFYINGTANRIMFDYPNIAEHFYYLYRNTGLLDIVFGSYDLDEVKRFVEYHNIKSLHELFVDESTICQYTGITDKKGKKIWENDIVKQFADCDELGNSLYFFYKIMWNKEYGTFEGVEIYSKETFLFPDLEDVEVIGNIFDNSGLLESQ